MKYIKKIILFISVVAMFFTINSCGPKTTTTTEYGKITVLSPKKIVEESDTNFITPEYLSATLKVKYQSKKKKASFTAYLRLEKDKKIWINVSFLGISFARGIITPEGVSMYERQNNTTFTGDFKYLSKLLGVELDFYQLQSLLQGKPIQKIEVDKYKTKVAGNSYLLEYNNNKKLARKAKNNGDFIKRYWYNPMNFELERQLISQPDRTATLLVNNKNYKLVENKYKIPENISLQIIDDSVTLVEIQYKGIKVDKKLTFPYRIPKDYKEIKLK